MKQYIYSFFLNSYNGKILPEITGTNRTELIKYRLKAELTELFLELKNDQTPAVVERIVTNIDSIV